MSIFSKINLNSNLISAKNQSIFFQENVLTIQWEFFKNIYKYFPIGSPNQATDPLVISNYQITTFGVNALSAVCSNMNAEDFFGAGSSCLALEVPLFSYHFFQNPNIHTFLPIGLLGLQASVAFTPLRPLLPYLNVIIKARLAHEVLKLFWENTTISLYNLNDKNDLYSSYSIYNEFQNGFSHKKDRIENDSIEEAQKILCGDSKTCPYEWTPQIVRRMYRKKALSFHPDKKTGSNASFTALNRARDILLKNLAAFNNIKEWVIPTSFPFLMHNRPAYPVLTNKEFAHVLCDPYIQGTDLEGIDHDSVQRLLVNLSQNLPASLRKKIQFFLDSIYPVQSSMKPAAITSMARDIAERIKNLPLEKDFWLLGGWNSPGAESHRLLYQWVKTKENTFDIYIYNLGGGLGYHYQETLKDSFPAHQIIDNSIEEAISEKTYFSPFVKFVSVSAEEIGLHEDKEPDPYLFERLITLFQNPEGGDRSNEVYLETFKPLDHRRIKTPSSKEDHILAIPQRSGTCAWFTVVHAALRKLFSEENLWRKLDFLRNQIAFDAHCAYIPKYLQDPERKELCLQGGRNFLLQLSSLFEILFNKEQTEKFRKNIQKTLDSLKKESFSLILKELPSLLYRGQSKKFPSLIDWSPDIPAPLEAQKIASFHATFSDLGNIDNLMIELKNIIDFPHKNLPYDVPIRIESLVKALPKPSEFEKFWPNSDKKKIHTCIYFFLEVFTLYASKTLSSSGRLLIEQNTAWALLAIMHHFSTRLDENLKQNYGIFYKSFAEIVDNPLFTSFHREDLEFYQQLIFYFKKIPQKNFIFRTPSTKERNIENTESAKSPEVDFLNSIASSNPEIAQKIADEVSRFEEYRKKNYKAFTPVSKEATTSFVLQLKDSFFEYSNDYRYIAFLRRASYLAQAFTKQINSKFDTDSYHINAWYTNMNGWSLRSFWATDNSYLVPNQNLAFPDLEMQIPKYQCWLEPNSRERENHAILGKGRLPHRLESATCQKELESDLLVDYFKEHIHELTEMKHQNMFLLTLFKSYSFFSPIHEAIKNPNFVASISEFIEKGLSLFCYKRNPPDVKTTLFFLQILRRLKEIDPTLQLRDSRSVMNNLLELKGSTDEELQMIHLHRILQYTNQKDRLNDESLKEILISWIYVNSWKFTSWHSIHSQAEAIRFIYDLSPVFENLSWDLIKKVLLEIFPEQFKQDELREWRELWAFDWLHGKVFRGGKTLNVGTVEDFTKYSIYKKLFGNRRFPLERKGETLVFQNDQGRQFRIFKKYSQLIVQMELEGEWYQYLTGTESLIELLVAKIPKALIADHFIFRSSKHTLFVRKDDFQIDFMDFEGGLSNRKFSLQESLGEDFHNMIGNFEKKDWILEKKYGDGSLEIQLPRFRSFKGTSLGFKQTDLGFSWQEDSRFLLKKAPEELLGLCSNYLVLQNGIKTKLLVPCKPVAFSRKFAPHCDLDIEDEHRQKEYSSNQLSKLYTGELNSIQENQYLFVEYDLQNGEIKPLNQEGTLFLSYLFLAQKDYIKALDLWNEVFYLKNGVLISEDSKKILSWIFQHGYSQDSYDRSPSSVAFSLRAALIFFNDQDKKKNFPMNLYNLWRNYQEMLDLIPAELRLSIEERKKIQTFIDANKIELSQNLWCSSKKEKWDHNSELEKFLEVYNDFQKAKTQKEKVFLNLKHYDYLMSGQGIFSGALDAVRLGYDAPPLILSDIPFSEKNRNFFRKTIEKMGNSANEDILLMNCRNIAENNPKKRELFSPSSLAHSILETKREIGGNFSLPAIELSQEGVLGSIARKFLMKKEIPVHISPISLEGFLKQPPKSLYQSAIETERKNFLEEYETGAQKNNEQKKFQWVFQKERREFYSSLQKYLFSENLQLKTLEKEILGLANRLPDDPTKKTLSLALIGGQAKSTANLANVIQTFLQGRADAYWALNSHLEIEEIKKLDQLISNFLRLSLEFKEAEKAFQIQDVQELGEILSSPMHYAAPEYASFTRQFLVYEYRSGLRMREEQVRLIRTMALEKNSVIQLMMGGGKTSVLASNLLYFAAQMGRIAFFIAPQSQFTTLKENLSNMQRKNFRQEVIPIQLKRDNLTIQKLEEIQSDFQRAKNSRAFIFTTRETIESLILDFLDSLSQKNIDEKKIHLLFSLIKDVKNFGDVLVDEVDLILDPMRETNFPIGTKTLISQEFIDVALSLFSHFISPKFEKNLRLSSNQQSFLSESDRKQLLLQIVEQFLQKYKDVDISTSEKQEFLQFVKGEANLENYESVPDQGKAQDLLGEIPSWWDLDIPFPSWDQEDRILIKKIKKYVEKNCSLDNLEQQVFMLREKMSLLKHLFTEVLPLTLSKSTGENYGRVLDHAVVGPYHGVGSPTFTDFGSPWEAMMYHFQTVLSKGVISSQLKDLYESLLSSAKHKALIQEISIANTEEAKIFKNLTSCTFSEFLDPIHMQKALDTINANPRAQLLIEANTIAQIVGYYPEYLRSTSQNFANSFSGFDSFSGTPWNVESFPKFLRDHFYADFGTEGKIADVFLQRAHKESLKIHVANHTKPQKVLSDLLETIPLEKRTRISGFIDTGGLFKEGSGLSIAQEFLEFYKNDPRIRSVLFFGRPTPSNPETLMALIKGSTEPVIIGSTEVDQIARFGISSDSMFVYYDQTHCEATDILQKPDAINIISVNHQMLRRTLMQGILRLRSYFLGQNVEVVISKEDLPHFSSDDQKLPTHQDLLLKLVDNQAIRKADQTLRSYKQKIDNVFTEIVMEKLLSQTEIVGMRKIFDQYRDILVQQRDQGLYAQFGMPELLVPTLESLRAHSDQKLIFFQSLTKDGDLLSTLRGKLEEIIQSANECLYLPSTTKHLSREGVGKELEIAQEVQQEVQLEQSLNKELQLELDFHQSREGLEPIEEIAWKENFFSRGFSSTSELEIHELKKILSEDRYKKHGKDYSSLFGERLLVSRNFILTRKGVNSIFDKKSKYAGQVLLIQEKGILKILLISTAEAKWFKDYINHKKPNHIWLIRPNGQPFTGNAPEMTEDLKNLLWQVHLFNGNVEALIQDPSTSHKKLKLNAQVLYDFLALKSSPKQRLLLSAYFAPHQKEKNLLDILNEVSYVQ